jgi:hypothetical protein
MNEDCTYEVPNGINGDDDILQRNCTDADYTYSYTYNNRNFASLSEVACGTACGEISVTENKLKNNNVNCSGSDSSRSVEHTCNCKHLQNVVITSSDSNLEHYQIYRSRWSSTNIYGNVTDKVDVNLTKNIIVKYTDPSSHAGSNMRTIIFYKIPLNGIYNTLTSSHKLNDDTKLDYIVMSNFNSDTKSVRLEFKVGNTTLHLHENVTMLRYTSTNTNNWNGFMNVRAGDLSDLI